MSKSLSIKPRVSEKAYGLSQLRNTYVFDVPGTANGLSVKQAVEVQFGVTVIKVNTTNIPGKTKRTYRRGGRFVSGKRNDVKKAYVTLKFGDNLPIFTEADEPTIPDTQKGGKSSRREKK